MGITIDIYKASTSCKSRPYKQKWILKQISKQGISNYLALNSNDRFLPKVFKPIIWCVRLTFRDECRVYASKVSSKIRISALITNLTHSEV